MLRLWGAVARQVPVAGYTFKFTGDVCFLNIRHDLVYRGKAGVPGCFSAVIAEAFSQFGKWRVGDHCQMGGRVHGIEPAAASAL